jgi:amidase
MGNGAGEALWAKDAVELAQLIRTRQVSSREVVQAHLERIEAVNPTLHAVVLTLTDEALRLADAADAAVQHGNRLGPLHGVPVTTKVNTDQAGCPTDNGVEAFRDLIATADNPVIANLKQAGAIVIGRTNTPAFSMRWFTDNTLHGKTLNPWDLTRTPGGSSGGASASVAAGMAPIGQGNDIAGSVRYPAYCCGLVGVRPSFGRVPAFNWTATGSRPISAQLMAVQGPLTRSVRDARVALVAMAVGNVNDPKWVDVPLQGPPLKRPLKVALVDALPSGPVNPEIKAAVHQAGHWLVEAGYAVEHLEPPEMGYVAGLWAKIGMDDVIRSLEPTIAKYGDPGIQTAVGYWRQGFPPAGPQAVLDALIERERVLRLWQIFLEDSPLVLMPSSGEPAFPQDLDIASFAAYQRIWAAQLPQLLVPVLGLPGVAVPTGLHDGVPVGVQLIGQRYREDVCLDAAEIIEARMSMPRIAAPVR